MMTSRTRGTGPEAAPREALLAKLAESAPHFAGRSAAEAERLRAALLAGCERGGLPPALLPFVFEDLESAHAPATVAAAARALRGADPAPAGAGAALLKAVERMAGADDAVEPGADGRPTTVLTELFRTIARLGPALTASAPALREIAARHASEFSAPVRRELRLALAALEPGLTAPSCCSGEPAPSEPSQAAEIDLSPLQTLALQDQNGRHVTFGSFFGGAPGVLTFFYTRCAVPEKCSLTITKLARLRRKLAEAGLDGRVNIAALTYDPAFDLPTRLHAYGADRGLQFDARTRLLRTLGSIDRLQRHLDLGVGFGPVTVNRHRIELYVLDGRGRVAASIIRRQWSEEEVLAELAKCCTEGAAAGRVSAVVPLAGLEPARM